MESSSQDASLSNNLIWVRNSQITLGHGSLLPEAVEDHMMMVAGYAGLYAVDRSNTLTAENNILVIDGNSDVTFGFMAGFYAGRYGAVSGLGDEYIARNNGVFIRNSVLNPMEVDAGFIHGQDAGNALDENNVWAGENTGGVVDIRHSTISLGARRFSIGGASDSSNSTDNHLILADTVMNGGSATVYMFGAQGNRGHYLAAEPINLSDNSVLLDHVTQEAGMGGQIYGAAVNDRGYNNPPSSEPPRPGAVMSGNSITIRNNSTIRSEALLGAWHMDIPDTVQVEDYQFRNNSINIENSIFEGAAIVAVSVNSPFNPGPGTAEDNWVRIGENVREEQGDLSLSILYGGMVLDKENSYRGNTLVLESRVTARNFGGFQNLQFELNDATLNSGAILTVTGRPVILAATPSEHLGNETSKVVLTGTLPSVGTEVELIKADLGFQEFTTGAVIEDGPLALTNGTPLNFEFNQLESVIRTTPTMIAPENCDLAIRDNVEAADPTQPHDQSLVVTFKEPPATNPPGGDGGTGGIGGTSTINDQTNTLVGSALSTLAATIAADDLFVDSVLRSRTGARQGLFAAARAGKYSYDTNTRLETNIVQGLLGFGASLGSTNVGGFIEMGHGSYDSRMNSLLGDVTGEGSQNFAGVGVYVDYGLPIDGWRLTGYIKGGQIDNSFNARIAGVNAGYDEENFYWGAHLGTHYDFDVADLMRARVFLSYFYNGVDSSSYDIAGNAEIGGAHISIDSINAHRVQAGSMLEFLPGSNLRPYLGLTVEQTIAAEASGTATDAKGTMDLNASDLEGTTGILSAGWTYSAGSFSTELGLNGYAGTRNGFSGQIQASWTF